jgi:protein-tyrosine phosphatase
MGTRIVLYSFNTKIKNPPNFPKLLTRQALSPQITENDAVFNIRSRTRAKEHLGRYRDKGAVVVKILFVCMGNICRSPTAEGVFRRKLDDQRKLRDRVEVDSAGTHGYHVGEAPDSRTQRAAQMRGYDLSQIRARKDKTNLDNLQRLARPDHLSKIKLFMDFSKNYEDDEVPDPYYGLGHGFDLVIDMVEDAAQGLIDALKSSIPTTPSPVGKAG